MIEMAKDWPLNHKPILVGENGATLAFPSDKESVAGKRIGMG